MSESNDLVFGVGLDGKPTGDVRQMVARKTETPEGVRYDIRVDDVDAMPIDPTSGDFSRDDFQRDHREERHRRFKFVPVKQSEFDLYVRFLRDPRSKHLFLSLDRSMTNG